MGRVSPNLQAQVSTAPPNEITSSIIPCFQHLQKRVYSRHPDHNVCSSGPRISDGDGRPRKSQEFFERLEENAPRSFVPVNNVVNQASRLTSALEHSPDDVVQLKVAYVCRIHLV